MTDFSDYHCTKIWVRLITNKYGCYIMLSLCNIHAFYLKLKVLILDNIPSESVLIRMIITMSYDYNNFV